MSSSSGSPQVHGLLVVDKPVGWTSHDVVARIRRLTATKRVGHAGTLDPFATGVLVIAVGKATRLLQYSQFDEKRYLAHVVLGAETDSADVDGELVSRTMPESWPEASDVAAAVSRYVGTVEQVPPAHSAIKVGGQRLYKRARAGEEVDVPSRSVTVHQIDVLDYCPPDIVLDIRCGSGTYIRSLARDIGADLNLGGYCHALRRTEVGPLTIDEAWTVDELDAIDLRERWPAIALHPDAGLQVYPATVLSEDQMRSWYHGSPVEPEKSPTEPVATTRVYAGDGRFLGLGKLDQQGSLRPSIVFIADSEGNTS